MYDLYNHMGLVASYPTASEAKAIGKFFGGFGHWEENSDTFFKEEFDFISDTPDHRVIYYVIRS